MGVGIGLVVALLVDRQLLEGQSDRPVIAAAITGVVALIWIALVRLIVWPVPAPTLVSKQKGP